MRHHIPPILILLVILTALPTHAPAEDEASAPELPYAVRKAEEGFGEDITKAQEEYSEAIKDAADDYIRVLEREKDRATRAAKLELALYLKKQIEEAQTVAAAEQILPPTEAGGEGDSRDEGVNQDVATYNAFKGREYRVDAQAEIIVLFNALRGEKYRVFIHPTDTWKSSDEAEPCKPAEVVQPTPDRMCIMVRVGDTGPIFRVTQGMILEGEGRVCAWSSEQSKANNSGIVRMKIAPIR